MIYYHFPDCNAPKLQCPDGKCVEKSQKCSNINDGILSLELWLMSGRNRFKIYSVYDWLLLIFLRVIHIVNWELDINAKFNQHFMICRWLVMEVLRNIFCKNFLLRRSILRLDLIQAYNESNYSIMNPCCTVQ